MRLLAFALGRELQYFDEPAVEKIFTAVEADDYRAVTLIEQIVQSYPFQYQTGRIHKEYRLPFADMGVGADLREVKEHPDYTKTREEILNMIWNMEEEIMGRTEESA